jgi:hypothetical protein
VFPLAISALDVAFVTGLAAVAAPVTAWIIGREMRKHERAMAADALEHERTMAQDARRFDAH